MIIQEIMTTDLEIVGEQLVAEQAYDTMKQAGIHHLIVMRADKSVGVVSERDLGGPKGQSVRAGKTVGELTSFDVITVKPSDSIRDAATLLQGYNIGSLLVEDENEVVGIITISDLLSLVAEGLLETV
ncbi:MAG: CBS domain-containing protein [Vampirovibrionales bacterium]